MKYLFFVSRLICMTVISGILVISCSEQQQNTNTNDPVMLKADTISEYRAIVKKQPIASYSQPVKDELNDWKFAVTIYETERRFHFTVRMQYKELRISDSINIPNLGKEPIVKIEKDSTPYSCTIGFLDNKGNFKPYYRANIIKEQLRFKKIAGYGVGVYRKKADGE